MGHTWGIGRVGAMAAAMGVGLAVAAAPGAAFAQPSSDSGSVSEDSSSPDKSPSIDGPSDAGSTADPTSRSGASDEDTTDGDATFDGDILRHAAHTDIDPDTDIDDAPHRGSTNDDAYLGEDPADRVGPDARRASTFENPETPRSLATVNDRTAGGQSATSAAVMAASEVHTEEVAEVATTATPASAVHKPLVAASPVALQADLVPAVSNLLGSGVDAPLGGGGRGTPITMVTALLAAVRDEVENVLFPRAATHATTTASLTVSPNLLLNPGAELGDPSLSGNSVATIPGWAVVGTPTAIRYGTPRNSWPLGVPFPFPDLPSFLGFPKARSGPPDGGAQFFGGGNTADATLTQTIDLNAISMDINSGTVTYDLSGWLGGYVLNPSSASVKVDFLDANKTYLSSDGIGPVGVLDRFFQTGLKQRSTSGTIPSKARYAQVTVVLDQRNPVKIGINADYNSAFADNIAFTVGANLPAPPDPEPPKSTVGPIDHVFMVYGENKGYDEILGSPNAPFINSLINAYGFADNYYGLTHPSLPNYYPVVGGSDYGVTYNCATTCIYAPATLTTNIDAKGKSWRGYAQSMVLGQPLVSQGDYATDELPFPAFSGIGDDPAYAAAHLFPLEQMAIDLSNPDTTPNFVWFAANEEFNGEGEDGVIGTLKFLVNQITPDHQYDVPALDQFLSETVPVIMNSEVWNSTESCVLIVTFDEDNNNLSLGFGDEDNHVVTVVIPNQAAIDAGMREGHFVATDQYNHYSLLRMIEDSLELPTLTNNDKWAVPMNEFWKPV